MQHRFTQPKFLNMKPSTTPRLIPKCYSYGEFGHTKLGRRQLLVKNNKKNITNQVRFLTNQVSYLIEMMTDLTEIMSSFRNV